MERDMELVRRILLVTEEMPFWHAEPTGTEHEAKLNWREQASGRSLLDLEGYRDEGGFLNLTGYLGLEGHSVEKLSYHVKIMAEAGLIESESRQANTVWAEYGGVRVHVPTALTWVGHEFLEAVREEARWTAVKNAMGQAGGFAADVIKAVAIASLERAVRTFLGLG